MFVLFHSNIRLSINSLLFNQHWLYVNVSTNVSTERTASEKRFPKMKRGLAGMIYLSYICTRNSAKGELSSVGSERLPYKQRVGGSNPSAPTNQKAVRDACGTYFQPLFSFLSLRSVRGEKCAKVCYFVQMVLLLVLLKNLWLH